MPKTATSSSYKILFDVAEEKATNSYSVLEDLKSTFCNEIDSRRRYACISTFHELVDCLHRRDVLSDREYQQLLVATGALQAKDTGILGDDGHVENAAGVNQYQQQRLRDELQHKVALNANKTNENFPTKGGDKKTMATLESTSAKEPLTFAMTPALRKEINRLIVREIGRKWKDLARELDYSQAQIAAIEMEHPRDLSSCVYKVLDEYEDVHRHDSDGEHLKCLCAGLQACGRADLVRKIKKIVLQQ